MEVVQPAYQGLSSILPVGCVHLLMSSQSPYVPIPFTPDSRALSVLD